MDVFSAISIASRFVFTGASVVLILVITTCLYEGCKALFHMIMNALEWRGIRNEHYPRRKAWMQ